VEWALRARSNVQRRWRSALVNTRAQELAFKLIKLHTARERVAGRSTKEKQSTL